MSKGFSSNYRTVFVAGVMFACFAAVGAKLVWLHTVNRDERLEKIATARKLRVVDTARRGDVVDARGAVLATSDPLIVLAVDPNALWAADQDAWPKLAALIGMPELKLRKIFLTKCREPAPAEPAAAKPAGMVFNFNVTPPAAAPADPDEWDDARPDSAKSDDGRREIRWAKLSDSLSEATYAQIEALKIRGLSVSRTFRRTYPHNQLAAHLIGFVNRQQNPVTGIEAFTDFYLRGQNGWHEGEHDGRNRELAQFRTREVPRADGYSVMLSIDTTVQDIVEQELAFIAQKFQPLKATIVVSDPRTGFILGLGNYPTFNLNEYNQVPKEARASMNNIALTDIYDPGSVFKIVAASAALEERVVTATSRFDCANTSIEYRGKLRSLPGEDHHFDHDHPLSVAEIIAKSSNRGAAQLAMRVGEEKFYAYARAFGFGERTGLMGLPRKKGDPEDQRMGDREEPGILTPPAKWDGLTITRMPMGQSVSTTVMQMHQAMTVIAAGGALLQPQLIQQVRDTAGEVVFRYAPVVKRQVVSVQTARTMAQMLAAVATKEGTAPEAAIPGFEVAGKTGTTQKLIGGHYSKTHHVSSFVGFFPASAPQVVISVIVDDADAHAPGGVGYGAKVAAPSFKKIAEQLILLRHLNIRAPNTSAAPVLLAAEGGRW